MNSLLKNASLEEIVKGYIETESHYICLFCSEAFEKGEIFEENDHYYDAKKMVEIHTEKEHGTILENLFKQDAKEFGLTEAQLGMLKAFAFDKSDEEIYDEFQITPSTIRNYRQKLREKQQQAKLLMAITELIDINKVKGTIHLNRKERQTIQNYFSVNGVLKEIPNKEKKRMVVLKHVVRPLKTTKAYTEAELIKYLKSIYENASELKQALLDANLISQTEKQTYIKQKLK